MLKFFMTPGSCTTGIHILLEELELVFEAHVLNMPRGDHRQPDYLALNPKGSIPALVLDDGRCLTEFQAIAWWLARSYPRAGLSPDDPLQEARVLELMDYVVGTVHMQGFARIFVSESFAVREEDQEVVKEKGREIVTEGLAIIAASLGEGDTVMERFGIADAALFYVEFWAERLGMTLPEACARHYQAMLKRRAVRQVLTEEGYGGVLNS